MRFGLALMLGIAYIAGRFVGTSTAGKRQMIPGSGGFAQYCRDFRRVFGFCVLASRN